MRWRLPKLAILAAAAADAGGEGAGVAMGLAGDAGAGAAQGAAAGFGHLLAAYGAVRFALTGRSGEPGARGQHRVLTVSSI
jgi:hypothetical protein